MSTFEKYGGFSTVSRVVMTFYEKVLENDDVGHHFDDVDMPRLIDHQTKFVSSLMGGPEAMNDHRLEVVHRKFDIKNSEFEVVLVLLSEAMAEHGMNSADIADVARSFRAKRSLIVSSTGAA